MPIYPYMFIYITHISLESFCGTYANSSESDQPPQNAASDQDLHYLLTGCSIKICPFSTLHDFCRLLSRLLFM